MGSWGFASYYEKGQVLEAGSGRREQGFLIQVQRGSYWGRLKAEWRRWPPRGREGQKGEWARGEEAGVPPPPVSGCQLLVHFLDRVDDKR